MRLFCASASVLTFCLTMVSGWVIGGWIGACLAGLVLLFMPERLVIGNHVWPEAFLALWLSGLHLTLLLTHDPITSAAICGAIILLASLTRIEQLVLMPAVLLVLRSDDVSITTPMLLLILWTHCAGLHSVVHALPAVVWHLDAGQHLELQC